MAGNSPGTLLSNLPNPPGQRQELFCLTDIELIHLSETHGINQFTFFLIPDSPLKVTNPYLFRKEILRNITDNKSVSLPTKSRNGTIVLTAYNSNAAKEIMAITHIQEIPISVKLSYDNILSDYVLTNIDTDLDLTDIVQDLQDQNIDVFSVNRFLRVEKEELIPLKTIKFRTPTPQIRFSTRVHIGVTIFYIRPYVEKPRQCTKCWLYGHGYRSCRSTNQICKKCAEPHSSESCSSTSAGMCRNCKESHHADHQECSARKKEEEILNLKRTNKISYREARELHRSSYASVTKQSAQTPSINPPSVNMTDLQQLIVETIHSTMQNVIQQLVATQISETIQPLVEVVNNIQAKQSGLIKFFGLVETPQAKVQQSGLPTSQGDNTASGSESPDSCLAPPYMISFQKRPLEGLHNNENNKRKAQNVIEPSVSPDLKMDAS